VNPTKALRLLSFVCLASVLSPLPSAAQDFIPVTDPEKTDTLVLRNGDVVTGDFRELQRGIVTFDTDAASTIHIKWPRVVTATTTKTFEIVLADGVVYVGSLISSDEAHKVVVEHTAGRVRVAVDSVVQMVRIKKTIWQRLDGSVDMGLDYTQQNAKVDFNLSFTIRYNVAHNRFRLNFASTFSSQDSVSDTRRRGLEATYARELSNRWFWAVSAGAGSNSQLGLDYARLIGTGPGRFLVLSNKVQLSTWVGLFHRTERYEGDDPRGTTPLSLTTDFQWFAWSGLSTDVSSQLVISPILSDSGRWRVGFVTSLSHDLVNNLSLSIGITEIYDSKPPSDVNKNDFNFTSSLGWTF
jgi:hypothetical protein